LRDATFLAGICRCSQRAAFTEVLWRMLCLCFLLFFC